jgi:predicted 3-demethylubiquinone-9 3-methyltransferase (glyoxalase superfamily)
MAGMKQKITACLWFDKETEEAMNYYISVFNSAPGSRKDSKIISIARYPDEPTDIPMTGMEGKVLTAIFELAGQQFMALDGGPIFKFNESVSFYVECDNQAEVDYFWERLSAAAESEQCGWLKDKYGLSWQIVPRQLGELLSDKDRPRALRVLNAMLKMKKIVIADLQKAYQG